MLLWRVSAKKQNFQKDEFFGLPRITQKHILRLFCAIHFFVLTLFSKRFFFLPNLTKSKQIQPNLTNCWLTTDWLLPDCCLTAAWLLTDCWLMSNHWLNWRRQDYEPVVPCFFFQCIACTKMFLTFSAESWPGGDS